MQILFEEASYYLIIFSRISDHILSGGGMLHAKPIEIKNEGLRVFDGLTVKILREKPLIFLIKVRLFDIHEKWRQRNLII